ncbi:DMT family transporter [Limimaricola pyoseonensis]|uniref:Permease of the drug/metabolite transporter (DMT) superfamily n=1 Tax=Limimaricola pyoseonensis TaxID=521013 RepID=A0A1G7CZ19_9RHOB|nr:DMT family transporter [Limimaricola pyoseonensis]SDE44582.1 Permease of the drug/metabolite transporter (DMT) superfamily [Limimaricola pyoseonensis]
MTTASIARSEGSPIAGIGWMVAAGLCFVGMTVLIKAVGPALPAAQTALLRFALGLPFLLPMLPALRRARITPRLWRLLGLRAVLHSCGVGLWFFAIARIPLGDVTAINYLNPIWVTVGAALLMGEPLPPRRLAAVGAAFVGAFVVLRPGLREIDPGHIAMMGTAMLIASGYLVVKRLSDDLAPEVIVAMLSLMVPLGLLPFALPVWQAPGAEALVYLFLAAGLGTGGHYAMTRAFAAAPLTVTQPVTFLQLVWAVAIGALLFGEPVDPFTLLGGAIIMGAVLFITWREARARRAATAATPDAVPVSRKAARPDARGSSRG